MSQPEPESAQAENLQSERDLASARHVLQTETRGLQALESWLGDDFAQAVKLIAATKGRLIVSGMGKSGHVGKKIVATMASTGTPSYFVHPGEASHGDLGMITRDDVVLLLSNSGETRELSDIVAYCVRFSIPTIGMVRRKESTLVQQSTVALILPDTPEVSPTGAPTTSTTMMIALGDALAIALLERRGFTREEFHVFHPGGKLGQAFTRVESLMHGGDEIPLVSPDLRMGDVLLVMTAKRFGVAGVVAADGSLQGVISDGDLRRHLQSDLLAQQAADVMGQKPVTIHKLSLAQEALAVMNEKSITSLFVVDGDDRPVGIIHIHDCLRAGIR